MMTSHKLARQLLAGPDRPVVVQDAEHGYGIVLGHYAVHAKIEDHQIVAMHDDDDPVATQLTIGGFEIP